MSTSSIDLEESSAPSAVESVGLGRTATLVTLAATAGATLVYLLASPALPAGWTTPGSPALYVTGVTGGLLMLTPLAFSLAKRCGWSARPPLWFAAHVVLGSLGMVLIVVHSGLHLTRAPALLLAAAGFLILQGTWARIHLPRRIAGIFGTRHHAFFTPDPSAKHRLERIIDEKRALLIRLAPGASEAIFSPLPGHWMSHPLLTLRYMGLQREEAGVIGQRRRLSPLVAYWRGVHMTVALLFTIGLVIHVITVTFFAGYVAGGGDIHWWHLTAWGGPGR